MAQAKRNVQQFRDSAPNKVQLAVFAMFRNECKLVRRPTVLVAIPTTFTGSSVVVVVVQVVVAVGTTVIVVVPAIATERSVVAVVVTRRTSHSGICWSMNGRLPVMLKNMVVVVVVVDRK